MAAKKKVATKKTATANIATTKTVTKKWPWWYEGTGDQSYKIRELLRAVWDLHAMYGTDAPWLWRGQANAAYGLEPAMHTRVRRNLLEGDSLDDSNVMMKMYDLVEAVRSARLDVHDGTRLPDMALLALLQHHGAATPLLDVSLDPLLGLYMAVVSPNAKDDDEDGALFAIKSPAPDTDIAAFDSRDCRNVYSGLPVDGVRLYRAPDVSERLRIQRGHFLIGRVSSVDPRVTIPLQIEPANTSTADCWIWKRMDGRNYPGPPPKPTTPVAVFRINAAFKQDLRKWLEARSGLTPNFVYPTAWHQPHLDRFAMSHGRTAGF